MRSSKVIIVASLVLAITAAFLLRSSPASLLNQEVSVAETAVAIGLSANESAIGKAPSSEAGQDKSYLQAAPLSEKEISSVKKLFDNFFKPAHGKKTLNGLIEELRASGLDPVMARDFNPYTGKMLTIRTNETLEGTRYFHAQFFEDDEQNKEPFRQHLSFEIRPSPNCMAIGRQIVESKLGKKLGKPSKIRGDEWIEWQADGESIWIKRLAAGDLNNSYTNARTIADIGTCRAAIEQIQDETHSVVHAQ